MKLIDSLFLRIDYVKTMRFLGGEPFLNIDFVSILRYLESNYRDRYQEIVILSNGSVIPSEELMDYMGNRSEFFVGITDYTAHVPYQNRIEEFCEMLSNHGIRYFRDDKNSGWLDLGFPEDNEAVSHHESVKRFDECSMHCRTLWDGKLWHCSFNSSAYRAGLIDANEMIDYIDLSKMEDKKQIIEFYYGYTKNGTNTLCKFCRHNEHIRIEAGEQILGN